MTNPVLIGTDVAQSSAGVPSLNITVPTNTIADDYILIRVNDTADDTWATPTGYTVLTGPWAKGSSFSLIVYGKKAVAGDAGATVVLDPSGSSRVISADVRVYRGVHTTIPLDGVTPTHDANAPLTVTAPSITPTTSGSTVVYFGGIRVPSGVTSDTWTAPSGFGNGLFTCSHVPSGSANAATASYDKSNVTGATGAISAVSAQGVTTPGAWVAVALVLRPSASTTVVVHPLDETDISDTVSVTLWPDTGPSSTLEFGDTFDPSANDTVQQWLLERDVTDNVGITDAVSVTFTTGPPGPDGPPPVETLLGTRYRFRPPTVNEGPAGGGRLFSRYRLTRGITVLKIDGAYVQKRYPSEVDLSASDVFYRGGHDHFVNNDEANALNDAGYGAFLTEA